MNQNIIIQEQCGKLVKLKELNKKFHGQVTIHFAHGVAKKIECNSVEDVNGSDSQNR